MDQHLYLRLTRATRAVVSKLPGGEKILRLPTLLCAAVYLVGLCTLLLHRDPRILRALFIPAVCFGVCTVLRPLIGRMRPYDCFGIPPVGAYRPGKGKSMPSRHTASAAAIACAAVYIFPVWPVILSMALLSLLIGALRVLAGQHYPSDVIAALALSLLLSAVGYLL